MHAQYVCWAELAYIQLLTPQASFLGHLGGILAGLLHVHVFERLTLSGAGALPGFRYGFIFCTKPTCCVQQDLARWVKGCAASYVCTSCTCRGSCAVLALSLLAIKPTLGFKYGSHGAAEFIVLQGKAGLPILQCLRTT